MQQALGLITAYDIGVGESNFDVFGDVLREVEHPLSMVQAMTQLGWLFLKSMEGQGAPRSEVMAWYGRQFASAIEELKQ